MLKRSLSVFLTVSLLLTLGAGFAAAEAPYAFPEGLELNYYLPLSDQAAAIISSFNENEAYKQKEEKTGVHVTFDSPPAGSWAEAFKLLIAGKDLPDIIEEGSGSLSDYPGGPDQAIADGVYIDLAPLIPLYAPNYNKLLEDPEFRKEVTTDKGAIPAFFCAHTAKEPAWSGPVVRLDWLKEQGLEIPVTLADWENMLIKFRDAYGCEAPLQLNVRGVPDYGEFVGAFDVAPGTFQIDGVVKYGPVEAGFRDYVTLMHKWYEEGLIDPEFPTRDGTSADALATTGRAGAWTGDYNNKLNTYISIVRKTGDEKYDLEAAPYPVREAGMVSHVRQTNFKNKLSGAFITTSCKDVEAAMRWMDWNYSEEGMMLFNYGIEGLTYDVIDGLPYYSDFYNKNPDGIAPGHMSWKYRTSYGPYLRLFTMQRVHVPNPKTDNTYTVWESNGDNAYSLPMVTYTAEESSERSRLLNEIKMYQEPMIAKFITGDEPLENFDAYLAHMKELGVDRVIEITQGALDRYIGR